MKDDPFGHDLGIVVAALEASQPIVPPPLPADESDVLGAGVRFATWAVAASLGFLLAGMFSLTFHCSEPPTPAPLMPTAAPVGTAAAEPPAIVEDLLADDKEGPQRHEPAQAEEPPAIPVGLRPRPVPIVPDVGQDGGQDGGQARQTVLALIDTLPDRGKSFLMKLDDLEPTQQDALVSLIGNMLSADEPDPADLATVRALTGDNTLTQSLESRFPSAVEADRGDETSREMTKANRLARNREAAKLRNEEREATRKARRAMAARNSVQKRRWASQRIYSRRAVSNRIIGSAMRQGVQRSLP